MRKITKQDFQKLNNVSTTDKSLNKVLEKGKATKKADINNDGKVTAEDFDANGDGKLDKKELGSLFRYADKFDSNGDRKSIANKGHAGQIYKATKKASQRYQVLSHNKFHKVSEQILKDADPPLNAKQSKELNKAIETLSPGVRKMLSKGKKSAFMRQSMIKFAREGKLGWVTTTPNKTIPDKAYKRQLMVAMMTNPDKADTLLKMGLSKHMSVLRCNEGSRFVGQIQGNLLEMESRGLDGESLLKDKRFYKLSSAEKAHVTREMVARGVKASELHGYLDKRDKLTALIGEFKGGNRFEKGAIMSKIKEMITQDPKSMHFLDPSTQNTFRVILMKQLGTSKLGEHGSNSSSARAIMKTIKQDDPGCYKVMFGKMFKAAQKGPEALSQYLKQSAKSTGLLSTTNITAGSFAAELVTNSITKCVSKAAGVGGAAAIGAGMITALGFADSGEQAIADMTTAAASGGLALAVSSTLATSSSILGAIGSAALINIAPAVIVTAWNAYCTKSVAKEQLKQSVSWMQTKELAP